MKRQLLVLLTGLLLCSLSSLAKNVDIQKALLVASNFSKPLHSSSLRNEGTSLKLVYTAKPSLRSGGPENYYYVFNIGEKEGYIIISGDDCARPVLGYSKSNTFDINQIPDNMKSWLAHYEEQIAHAASNSNPSPEAEAEWEKLQTGTTLNSLHSVVDLKTVNWGQGEPFNAQCDENLTGCVATAMAIVMKYHEWPIRGTGSHTIPNTQYSANFDAVYDWNNMVRSYPGNIPGTPPAYTQAQADAVATLMYHCAVSVNAKFGTGTTSAYVYAPENALITHFGYARDVACKTKRLFPNYAAWEELLKAELDAKRPVIYSGQSIYGGHSFVCDGYDNSGRYQINWGWNGYCNGLFALTALIPSEDNPKENYSKNESMIIHIKKSAELPGTVKYSGLQMTDHSNRVGMTSDKENVSKGDPFSIETGIIQNSSTSSFNGKLAIALTTADNQVKEILSDSKDLSDFSPSASYGFPLRFDCLVKTSTVEATDLIRTVTNTTSPYSNLNDWEIVDAKGADMASFIKAKGHQITQHKVILPIVGGVDISIRYGTNPMIHGRDMILTVTPSHPSCSIEVKANGKKIVEDEYNPTYYYLYCVKEDVNIEVKVHTEIGEDDKSDKPLTPPNPNADITLGSDSTYTDSDGNQGGFNGTIGTDNTETVINKLTITGSTPIAITLNQITIGDGNTKQTTVIAENASVIIHLLGENSLGELVNSGTTKLTANTNATLLNTTIINNGIFMDETSWITKVEGAAALDITAPENKEVPTGSPVTLLASTEVNSAYSVTFTWEQQQPDGTWNAIGTPKTHTPARSGLRAAGITVEDKLVITPSETSQFRCVIKNTVGDVSTTLITHSATVTLKSTVDNTVIGKERNMYVQDRTVYLHVSVPTVVQVINFNGQIIHNRRLPAGETRIEGLEQGFYIIRFGNNQTVKITI